MSVEVCELGNVEEANEKNIVGGNSSRRISFFQSARLPPERSFVLRSNKSTANNESFT